ncbi:conserved hypothetical protein [Perkinsus marinus ATCC 50983]|uniref:Folate/biopterin transporter n=1 Tax=Perkinsus marinus (strain ATCC 50983 / TXsc) TaxID=423536 RepID=C5KXI5_PERM5|nr:conserved hypothetical protein [Perkinsus marinus ATCC 50983]EER10709.1 conserved hypothetical protein [Perkinsus marinus ATCC 50983]|eukprot:XP_002778914.1 conserved hypothetical protein [Perkinsus marinus ATCC 50983]
MVNSVVRFYFQDMNVPGPFIDRYMSIVFMPFALKPWMGLLSDCYPIFGYKRMPYLVGAAAIGIAGTLLAVLIVPSPSVVQYGIAGLFMMIFYWITCADLLSEAVYSRKVSEVPTEGPALVGYVTAGQKIVGLVAGLLAGIIIQYAPSIGGHTGSQWALGTTIIPSIALLVPVSLNYLGEEKLNPVMARDERKKLWKEQPELVCLSLLVGAIVVVYSVVSLFVASFSINLALLFLLLIIVLVTASMLLNPTIGKLVIFKSILGVTRLQPSGAAQYFFTDDAAQFPGGPNFSALFYGSVVTTVGILAGVVAVVIVTRFMASWTYRRVYIVIILVILILQLGDPMIYSRVNLEIGVPDKVFVIGSTALVQVGQILIYMPGFLMLSYMCPKNVEGLMFALLAASFNFSFMSTGSITGFISKNLGVDPRGLPGVDESSQFDNLWIVSLVCIGLQLIPLAFLWLLPNVRLNEHILLDVERASATANSPLRRFLQGWNAPLGKDVDGAQLISQ